MRTLTAEPIKNLTDEELECVAGGTFFPNTYSSGGYNEFGISTRFHILGKDEFYYMGRRISYDRANEIMKIGNEVKCSLNSGYDHKNNIGSSENAFIRAFNYQLKLRLGDEWMWNGVPGSNDGWALTDRYGALYF